MDKLTLNYSLNYEMRDTLIPVGKFELLKNLIPIFCCSIQLSLNFKERYFLLRYKEIELENGNFTKDENGKIKVVDKNYLFPIVDEPRTEENGVEFTLIGTALDFSISNYSVVRKNWDLSGISEIEISWESADPNPHYKVTGTLLPFADRDIYA